MEITPIGIVKSCFKERFGTPRQSDLVPSAEAWIEFDRSVQPEFSLERLDGFSHIWVIFQFHKNTNQKFTAKVHPPRLQGHSVGVYATRSPHRPNSIGLSLVEIREVQSNRIRIGAHDLVDGTPVLDIKPYLKESESKPNATSGWSEGCQYKANLVVKWIDEALESLRSNITEPDTFKALVDETLSLDPRPLVYKSENYKDEIHAIRLHDWDVHFNFSSPGEVTVLELKPWPNKN